MRTIPTGRRKIARVGQARDPNRPGCGYCYVSAIVASVIKAGAAIVGPEQDLPSRFIYLHHKCVCLAAASLLKTVDRDWQFIGLRNAGDDRVSFWVQSNTPCRII